MKWLYIIGGICLLGITAIRGYDAYVAFSGQPVSFSGSQAALEAAIVLLAAGTSIGRGIFLIRRGVKQSVGFEVITAKQRPGA